MARTGVLAGLERVRLPRRGYGLTEVFSFLVVYLAAGSHLTSMRAFYAAFRKDLRRVAALVDRRALPASSSVSRALHSMTPECVGHIADVLLLQVPGIEAVLSNPNVQHTDAFGTLHQIVDFDPTVRASRQRDLESGDDLPEPVRRALGVPGYTGRHRGEIRYRVHAAHHGGSGLWLQCTVDAKGGSPTQYVETAAIRCGQLADRIGQRRGQWILRMDGEFGHAAAAAACERHGVHFLTRLTRPRLYERAEVLQALNAAEWMPVAVFGGLPRQAADLGTLMLHDTDEPDALPVKARVVLTRFRSDRAEPGRGVLRDGYQVEMFGTSLPADGWPAADVARLYADRAIIENRLAEEDREYALYRRFSDDAAGQGLCIAVGLFLWNYSICRVADAARLPAASPSPEPRPAVPEQPDVGEDLDAGAAGETNEASAPPSAEDALVNAEDAPDPRPPPTPPPATDLDAQLNRILVVAALNKPRSGFVFDLVTGQSTCPAGKTMYTHYAEASRREPDGRRRGQDRITARTLIGACDGCPLRSGCFRSTRTNTCKQISFALSNEDALQAVALIKQRNARRPPVPARPPRHRVRVVPPGATIGEPRFQPLPRPLTGPWQISFPTFRPAVARKLARDALESMSVEVTLGRPRRRRGSRWGLTGDRLEARHRRQSWTERRQSAHPGAVAVTAAPHSARAILFGFRAANSQRVPR
jgi:hypothetical protein